MRNVSAERLTIDKFPPVVSLMQYDTGQPVYTFSGTTAPRTLAANEVARVTLTWDQVDYRGIPVTGGFYLELEDLESRDRAIQLDLSRPVRFEITSTQARPAETRRIDVHQSRSDNFITVNLLQVVLSDSGISLYAEVTPPEDYELEGYRPTRSYAASAEYSIDGAWVKDGGVSSVEYLADGMKHTWQIAETVPQGAEELYFNITGIGRWPGSWQFYISLK